MKFSLKAFSYIAVPVFTFLVATSGTEVSAAEMSAEDVVAMVNAVPEGEYVTRKLAMELTDRRGKTRLRETINYRKYFGDEKKTVILFLAPANVRDTAFLTWDYPDAQQDDDQWLYLPALRKIRRVSAADRGDYFMGTDFTYEDIKLDGKLSATDYDYKILNAAEPGTGAIKLEALPRSEDIADELGYSRTVATIDPENGMVMEVEFWDTKGQPLKHLVAGDISQVDGIWTRHRLEMENLQTGHHTRLIFSEVDYASPIEDDAFSRQALARGR